MCSIHVKDRIDLTYKERKIFDHLLQVTRRFNLQTQLRVAGGWVRDKLLGKDSYDIDIALDDMLGREFCVKLNDYLSSVGEETHRICEIPCNPDQSKHLETARMCLFDVWIDFVNLRAEGYCGKSRIPTMRFGTAEEDAYRRDLTINSLFYNIHTSSIEDFTGRGIKDLKSGKIVTPLLPKQTFLDDPLRVLRAIRFGARFGFLLDGELKEAAANDEVIAAIAGKISRERIGLEIDLMMSGNEPLKAMVYLSELQLFWAVFSLPPSVQTLTLERCERICIAYMDSALGVLQLIGSDSIIGDQLRLFLYAALLLPLRNTVYKVKKEKKIPVVSYIFRESLKLKASDCKTVLSMHIAAENFSSLIPSIISDENLETLEVDKQNEIIDVSLTSKRRILTGLLLREIKELWRPSLVLSLLLHHQNDKELDKRMYSRVENAILDMGLNKVWELKPLLDGNEIMDILQMKLKGPDVGKWKQKVLQWQLAYPSGSMEECVDWMRREAKSKHLRTK